MKMWDTLGTVRDLGRMQEIASVLIKYGFGDIVRRIGMGHALERAGKLLHWQHPEELARLELPARARRALEELGPTFVKFGQVLATRVDLLPPEAIRELGNLQNSVPPAPWDEIREQLVEDLGDEPENVFVRFEPTPLASASLGQAYRAWLDDDTPLVLKVRRPGIVDVVDADLRLLTRLADIVEAEAPDLRRYRPREVVRQFGASLRRELDFAAECRNAERIAGNFAGREDIYIPEVYWEWTSERLNVQAFVDGISARDLAAVDAAGFDRRQLARNGAAIVLKMVLEDGYFHADPHQGNVFYLPGERIGLIDFGMVGQISEQRRFQIVQLLYGMVAREADTVADVLLGWGSPDGAVDDARLNADLGIFIEQYRGVPLKELRVGSMLLDAATIMREHGLALPADLALMIKAFLSLEGMARQLDPDFDMVTEAQPFLERAMRQRFAPRRLLQRSRKSLFSTVELLGDLPADLRRLLQAARRGRLKAQVEVPSLKSFGDQINHAANRLTMGIITAALVIGSSIVMNSVAGGSRSGWLMALGVLGFIGAALCGVYILLSIWRSNRH